MLLFRLSLVLALFCYLAAYPVSKQGKQSPRIDPADYPDLTNGLSDAEVESTLNGLSLEDLNELNKLLDDANNGPINLEASLRGHHRQAKKHHYEEMENADEELESALNVGKQSVDDNCHDDDDFDKDRDLCTMRPKCNKQPTCSTTKRCTSTRKCFTTSCRSFDGLMNTHLDGGGRLNKMKCRKLNSQPLEECDPEDAMCLQRNHDRVKQQQNLPDFSDLSMDQDQNNIDSLEKLAAEAQQEQTLKQRKDLDNWQSKDEPSSDIFNMEPPYKMPNVDANDLKELPKLAEEESQQPAQHEEQNKQAEVDMLPYERHQLGRAAHREQKADEDRQQPEEMENLLPLDDNMQMNAAAEQDAEAGGESQLLSSSNNNNNNDNNANINNNDNNMAANDGDSFIAQNAREPLRYVIQTNNGYIKSENELGEQRLRADKQCSEMLNYATNQLYRVANTQQYKRLKRDNKSTDDAPENTNESYLKKLMDSFPRDQGSQSNLNIAIREAKRIHLRVKRC